MNWQERHTVFVTCGPSLEVWLERELSELGCTGGTPQPGGVEIRASLTECMRLNLMLRTAYNVLLLLKQFPCDGPDTLYHQIHTIPWEEMIPPDEYLCVVSRVEHPSIQNTMFANLKVKDAIVDRIAEKTGRRPDSGPLRNRVVVHLHWRGGQARLYLNTSGVKLSDRNYRKIPHKAPLRESLAAAILMATGYDGTVPLIAPMCGSGTLAIEAALIAAHRPPGLLRSHFAFLHLCDVPQDAYKILRIEAAKEGKKAVKNAESSPIIASDIDPAAVEAAKKNAQTAGVEHQIEFHVCDFASTPLPPLPPLPLSLPHPLPHPLPPTLPPALSPALSPASLPTGLTSEVPFSQSAQSQKQGIIVMNPEYGKRLGEIRELEETYRRIGDWFKQQCAGYTGYVFTGNLDLAKQVGLRTSARIPFYNADIECRLLRYAMYAGSRKSKYQTKGEDHDSD